MLKKSCRKCKNDTFYVYVTTDNVVIVCTKCKAVDYIGR